MKWALLVLAAAAQASDTRSPTDALRATTYDIEEQLWQNVTDNSWGEGSPLGADVELMKAFARLADEIDRLPNPNRPKLQHAWLWKRATEKMQVIDGMYVEFEKFARHQATPGAVPSPVKEWLDLAETVLIDPNASVQKAVDNLDEHLKHGDLFRSALQEDHPDLCDLQLSPHQLVYDMYNTISLTEIKGYAMMQFSWMLLRIYGKGNFTHEANLARQRYDNRVMHTATAARAALKMAKRDIHRCDPLHHVEGETYEQVTKLLQGYIENEVDMNKERTCRENCAHYTLAENKGCYGDMYCARQKTCNGRIIGCSYIDSDMWICPASKGSLRRYEWIEYENERTFGRTGSCPSGAPAKVDSWWRWLFWHCSYCMCLCDEPGPDSDRYFSLREAVAHIKSNMVVTGVRLVKKGRVFHLQISEGILGERGSVEPKGWVPVEEFDPTDPEVEEGRDYHTLTYERRAIDLDELDSKDGSLLTGVKYSMIGAHLHFEIRLTPFNFATGKMMPEKSIWHSNDNTEGAEEPRTRLEMIRPDIPTRYFNPLPVDSKHDQYIEFTHTDYESDAAQTTVPFVDVQELQPLKGTSLLSGAGMIHRGLRGNGGFIALKTYTYDYSRHVHAAPPPPVGPTHTEFNPIVN